MTISGNKGSGIHHCNIVFTKGHSIIAHNHSPTDGGGVFLGKDSYLTTGNGGHISLTDMVECDYIELTLNIISIAGSKRGYGDQCIVYNPSLTTELVWWHIYIHTLAKFLYLWQLLDSVEELVQEL